MKNFWGVFFFLGGRWGWLELKIYYYLKEKNETQLKKKDALQSLQKFVK